MTQRRATHAREVGHLEALAVRLATQTLKLSGKDPDQFIEWKANGDRTPDGRPIYVGSKTQLHARTYEELHRLHAAIEDLRAAGWTVTAPRGDGNAQ